MGVYLQAVRLSLAVAAIAALAGCDQPKWRGKQPAAEPKAAAAQAPAVRESTEALPAGPAWAAEALGKPLRALYPNDGECVGNTDNVDMRYTGAQPGVKIVGWGWDPGAKQPVSRVVLIDRDFNIVGVGETGLERLDVPAARPEVTSTTTGWWAVTKLTKGPVDSLGVLADGKTVCKLGHLEF